LTAIADAQAAVSAAGTVAEAETAKAAIEQAILDFTAAQKPGMYVAQRQESPDTTVSLNGLVIGVGDKAWTGKKIASGFTVRSNGELLVAGTDYTVTSTGANKAIGKGSVTITGKGAYKDSKALSFNIVPKKLKIGKLTVGKKRVLTAKWGAATKAQKITGYQLRYKVKSAAKWTTKSVAAKKASLKLTKLKKGKKYSVQVRAVKKISSGASKGVYYGAWSAAKTSKAIKK
jgi:hypothetical protein